VLNGDAASDGGLATVDIVSGGQVVMSDSAGAYWKVVEPLFEQVDIYNGGEKYLISIAQMPRPFVLLYAAHFSLSEIYNGGFLQFLRNSTGVLAPEAVEGFDAVGMPQLGAVIRETIVKLGEPYPRDRQDRWDALLVASGLDEGQLNHIFAETDDSYRAFAKATATLLPFELDKRVYSLADTENGGFDLAADRYVESLATT
jgi:hypothetical protein